MGILVGPFAAGFLNRRTVPIMVSARGQGLSFLIWTLSFCGDWDGNVFCGLRLDMNHYSDCSCIQIIPNLWSPATSPFVECSKVRKSSRIGWRFIISADCRGNVAGFRPTGQSLEEAVLGFGHVGVSMPQYLSRNITLKREGKRARETRHNPEQVTSNLSRLHVVDLMTVAHGTRALVTAPIEDAVDKTGQSLFIPLSANWVHWNFDPTKSHSGTPLQLPPVPSDSDFYTFLQ